MIVILIFITSTALWLFYKYVEFQQSYWKRKRITSITPVFLLGNHVDSWTQKRHTVENYEGFYRKFRKSDRIIGLYQFLKPQALVVDRTLVKEICVTNFRNFRDTSFSTFVNSETDPLLARNPFFLAGDEWKEKRAEITPAFSPARIKAMYPLVEEIAGRIVAFLETNTKAVEARDLCSRFTCDVVSNCIFGADAESFIHEKPKILEKAKSILGSPMMFLRLILLGSLPGLARVFKIGLVPRKTQDFFSTLMGQAVEKRRSFGVSRQDYLDYLLQMQGKKQVSDVELAANAITFFVDGLDTSGVGIAAVLYELGRNKDVQQQLRQELEGVSGYEALAEVEYLDLVFSEALRLHPPAGFMVRECTESLELDVGKDHRYQIPKGGSIIIPAWSFHHDEDIYENPEKFNPERMSNGELKRLSDEGVYLSFGMGPRSCIGQRFAKAQSKACIAAVVKNFQISVDTKTILPLQPDPKELLTYYKGGLWLQFSKI